MRMTNSGQLGDMEGEGGKGSVEDGACELSFQRGGIVQQVEGGTAWQRKHNTAMRH